MQTMLGILGFWFAACGVAAVGLHEFGYPHQTAVALGGLPFAAGLFLAVVRAFRKGMKLSE